jgi:hypothetical protein
MKTKAQIKREYQTFIADTGGVCWRCGRGWSDMPHWYWAEWRIDPHHIVRKPRKNDRRAVIPLCAACHSVEHGAKHTAFDLSSGWKFPGCKPKPLTLEESISLKAERDPNFFDPEFLASCSVKRELVLSICREIMLTR